VTRAAKSGQFTADEMGKGQFPSTNRRNLAGEGVVRKISSLKRIVSVPNLCNGRGQWAGTWINGIVALVLVNLPVHFQEVQHDQGPTGNLRLHGRRGNQKDPKYPRRTMVG